MKQPTGRERQAMIDYTAQADGSPEGVSSDTRAHQIQMSSLRVVGTMVELQ